MNKIYLFSLAVSTLAVFSHDRVPDFLLCTVHGHWTSWESGPCSVTCDGWGILTKTRSCSDPSPSIDGDDCPGEADWQVPCFAEGCPGIQICQ